MPHGLENFSGLLSNQSTAEREGLPRGFRMRADSHYVDQLESRYQGRAIRLISTDHIDAAGEAPAELEPLVHSIAAHGVLQPLLVRRHNDRYRLITGRRRLAAATAAGLTDVPCLVHDADDAKAAQLAEADNLRDPGGPGLPTTLAPGGERLHDALGAIAAELDTLHSSAMLLKRASSSSFHHRVAVDLAQAQAWRAAWLAQVTSLVTGQPPGGPRQALGLIFDRVRTGFAPEASLSRLKLDFSAAPDAGSVLLEEGLARLAISGGIFATVSWLQEATEPRVEVHAEAPSARAVRIEIVQRTMRVPADTVRRLQQAGPLGSGDVIPALGLLALDALAARLDGTFSFSTIGDRGSLLQITVPRR